MSNLKVLVVEDEEASASYLKSILLQFRYEVVYICTTLEEAVEAFNRHDPDICIIDIYLKKKPDGIIFAEEINQRGIHKKPFLFLTSSYDPTTFRLAKFTAPYSYLLKPYNPLELEYALELAIEKFKKQKTMLALDDNELSVQNNILFIKRGNTLAKIGLNDIIYIEVEGKYCKIICHLEKFLVLQPLKELLAKLPENRFFRLHRNYAVNIHEVSKIDTLNEACVLKNGESLAFSRRYVDEFLNFFKVLK